MYWQTVVAQITADSLFILTPRRQWRRRGWCCSAAWEVGESCPSAPNFPCSACLFAPPARPSLPPPPAPEVSCGALIATSPYDLRFPTPLPPLAWPFGAQ